LLFHVFIIDDNLVGMVTESFSLSVQKVDSIQLVRHPVQSDDIQDVYLLSQTRESQLKFAILIYPMSKQGRVSTAGKNATAQTP
jgi:hypothetical protein